MFDNLTNDITDLFTILKDPIHSMFKITAIINFKKKYNINLEERIGEFYRESMESKVKGAIFTPGSLADYLIKNSVDAYEIIENPFIKILDPCCGNGNILIPLFFYLKEIYKNNLKEINILNNLDLKEEDIDKHILDNNIFGCDLDDFSIKILKTDLFYISSYINENNIKTEDYLLRENDEKFHIIIGNPPYIGHKTVSKDYSKIIKKKYKIYKDKGDISYCFFQKSFYDLMKNGKLTYITSRYFMEAPSGEILRKLIMDCFSIDKIVDFYGLRPFKNKGIDPAVLFLKKSMKNQENVVILRPKNGDFLNGLIYQNEDKVRKYNIKRDTLETIGWSLIEPDKKKIIDKIKENSFITLKNIASCHQGVITGLDKAFVIDSCGIEKNNIEKDIIRRWIKNSQISKYHIHYRDLYLIYSDSINPADYPNTIKYLLPFKEKLMERRECRNDIRNWYEVQWGREEENFQGEKIVFPYKSDSNKFALDNGSFHSADIYSIRLLPYVPFTYNFLLSVLNSKTYEFYFKTFGKKLGENMYDYYPNNLMKLCIPAMPSDDTYTYDDTFLYKYFDFTEKEIKIIESMNI